MTYFTKNENPEQRFVIQREKRWKDNRKNLALTLAQLHIDELEKSKQKKVSKKKKAHISMIQSMFFSIFLCIKRVKSILTLCYFSSKY